LFAGFEKERVETTNAEIELVHGGDGPPVLLLHGYPQTHAMRHFAGHYLAEERPEETAQELGAFLEEKRT